jgi:hypothetical protein
MKFKSAEADWNTSFVSQHVEGRNPGVGWRGSCIDGESWGWVYWTGDRSRKPAQEMTSMKRYLKFAAGFWMSAFLMTGSMVMAQTTSTTKAKKRGTSSISSTAPAPNTTQPQSGATTAPAASADTSTTQTAIAPNAQPNTTTTTGPKMMIGPDKHMIPVPQE